jgi:hypothetical protein
MATTKKQYYVPTGEPRGPAKATAGKIEAVMRHGQWLTVAEIAAATGCAIRAIREALDVHPLADFRPLKSRIRNARLEWTLQTAKQGQAGASEPAEGR